MKKFHNRISILIAVSIIILDQLTKYICEATLKIGETVPLIKNFIHLTLVHNKGAGFGILQNQRIFFVVFSLIVLAAIIYKWKKIPEEKSLSIPLGLILGGIIGNLIDRAFLGYVIDFIDFRFWPVFNVADSCISIGVVWLAIYIWTKKD